MEPTGTSAALPNCFYWLSKWLLLHFCLSNILQMSLVATITLNTPGYCCIQVSGKGSSEVDVVQSHHSSSQGQMLCGWKRHFDALLGVECKTPKALAPATIHDKYAAFWGCEAICLQGYCFVCGIFQFGARSESRRWGSKLPPTVLLCCLCLLQGWASLELNLEAFREYRFGEKPTITIKIINALALWASNPPAENFALTIYQPCEIVHTYRCAKFSY